MPLAPEQLARRQIDAQLAACGWVVQDYKQTYRARGHRRLDLRAYENFCHLCIWGCRMAVEMTIDQWNPEKKQYRKETFCYGPKSCSKSQPGPVREVPGRNGTTWLEEDWVDEEATSHRGPDD